MCCFPAQDQTSLTVLYVCLPFAGQDQELEPGEGGGKSEEDEEEAGAPLVEVVREWLISDRGAW